MPGPRRNASALYFHPARFRQPQSTCACLLPFAGKTNWPEAHACKARSIHCPAARHRLMVGDTPEDNKQQKAFRCTEALNTGYSPSS